MNIIQRIIHWWKYGRYANVIKLVVSHKHENVYKYIHQMCLRQEEGKDNSGEYKYHQVYASTRKQFPMVDKKLIALLINWIVLKGL